MATRKGLTLRLSEGRKTVRAWPMMQQFGINLAQTVRFIDSKIEDGILLRDLRKVLPVGTLSSKKRGSAA